MYVTAGRGEVRVLPYQVAEEASCNLQLTSDRSTINMESKNQSCEKLVAVEAGLTSPQKPSNFQLIGIPHRYKSPKKCTNWVFILLATLLLATTSWQVWQIVRNEQIVKEIKAQNFESERQALPLVQEDPRIQEMTEEFKKLQNTLTEMQKKIDRQDQIPKTAGLPSTTSGQPPISDDIIRHKPVLLFEKILGNNDEVEPLNSDTIFTKFPIHEKDISQDEKLHSSAPIQVTKPIEETASGFRWTFSFGFGGKSEENEEADKSRVSNVFASDETESEEATSAETESASSERGFISYIPGLLLSPFSKAWAMPWGWYSSDIEEGVDSKSVEGTEESVSSEETQSIESTVVPTSRTPWALSWGWYSSDIEEGVDSKSEEGTEDDVSSEEAQLIESTEVPASRTPWTMVWGFDSPGIAKSEDSKSEEGTEEEASSEETQSIQSTEVPADDYNYDDNYEDIYSYDRSYEYSYSPGNNFYDANNDDTEVSTSSSTETAIADSSTTESPSAETNSTISVGNIFEEPPITAAPVSSSSESTKFWNFFSDDDNPDGSTDFYGLGSVLSQSLAVGPAPNNEDYEDSSTSAGEDLEVVPTRDYRELSDSYLRNLLARRLAEVRKLDELFAANVGDVEDIGDEFEADSSMDDDNSESFERSPSTSTSREWSYISKRSVDEWSALERPRDEPLPSKKLERKMIILQQSIDDDNHFLLNEVSLTPEPMKRVLQAKLNRFYAKMEAVSAHIDRLHERFLRLNKLDDDYVSREFPSEDANANGGWISGH